ncbi:MAG: TlpA family protein disulfide reductase [Verrucomicrobia bacterium]|nr:MAG: TlpA family protein disulfide reductase [Verrucomicrobiota bacterium]
MKSKMWPKRTHRLIGMTAALLACAVLPLLAAWKVGEKLPALTGYGLAGRVPATADRVVLLDFWASWCGPCKRSFPELDQLNQSYRSRGLVVCAVSVDDKADDMDAFLKDHPVSFSVVRDAEQKLVAAAGVESMPTSFLVDRHGVIRFSHVGFRGAETVEQLKREIEKLLAEK